MKPISAAQHAWTSEVKRLADSGYYKDQTRADNFFYHYIEPVWNRRLALGQDESVSDRFDITKTTVRILYFFAAAVLNRAPKSRGPKPKTWPAVVRDSALMLVRSVPKSDIARIVGCHASAVQRTVDWARGKSGANRSEVERVFMPIALDTGMMLDIYINEREAGVQLSFNFNFDVGTYTAGKTYAVEAPLQIIETYDRQAEHCRGGIRSHMRSVPAVVSSNDERKEARGA